VCACVCVRARACERRLYERVVHSCGRREKNYARSKRFALTCLPDLAQIHFHRSCFLLLAKPRQNARSRQPPWHSSKRLFLTTDYSVRSCRLRCHARQIAQRLRAKFASVRPCARLRRRQGNKVFRTIRILLLTPPRNIGFPEAEKPDHCSPCMQEHA
jgi:hypothetical protein